MPEVTVPSGILRVESVLQLLILPVASLYTMFHGFADVVAFQYCFQDCTFAFLRVAPYVLFSCRVHWYHLPIALNFFLIIVSSSVHQSTDL